MTEEEAQALAQHDDVAWVELSHKDNAESFPVPYHATIQDRFGGDKVKTYRYLSGIGNSVGELNRTNWGVARVGFLRPMVMLMVAIMATCIIINGLHLAVQTV